MRVLVLWGDEQSTNMGVQALGHGLAALARQVLPASAVEFQSYGPGPAPHRFAARTLAAAWSRRDDSLTEWLRTYDLVIDSGAGDSFSDIYGLRRLVEMSALRELVVRAGTPLVLGPQTIGPFSTSVGRRLARRAVHTARLVIARDSASADYCRTELGRQASLGTDAVFAIERTQPTGVRDVVLNVSGLLWEPNPHVDHVAYRRESVAFCRGLLAAGRDVTLLCHVASPAEIAAAHELNREAAGDLDVVVPGDLREARAVIAGGDLTIGARMHASLNSLSLGVPAQPWAYSRKFGPLMDDLQWPFLIDARYPGDLASRGVAMSQAMSDVSGHMATTRLVVEDRLAASRAALARVVDSVA